MSIAESLLPEFDHEMASTRKVLERIPEGDGTWKPHVKSMEIGKLGLHLATLPGWAKETLEQDEFDLNPPGGSTIPRPVFESVPGLLETFDTNVQTARAAIAGTSDADMIAPWTLKNGGDPIMTMPRVAVLRSMVMNHMIHHRGQLGVYLRLNDIPVPGVYGPSADESGLPENSNS